MNSHNHVIESNQTNNLDFKDIIGHTDAKWAMQIAAAGGHHMMMIGSPSSGKTMLAQRICSILPQLTPDESLEIARIQSASGEKINIPLSHIPPFISLHHNASLSSLTGSFSYGKIHPGAMSRAHNGVLFLDEAPEFDHRVLQALRTPLETGEVSVSRARGTIYYPARFQLILASNPCPCGNFLSSDGSCTCTAQQHRKYRQRISVPLQDRIDIKLELSSITHMSAVDFEQKHGFSSNEYSALLGDHAQWDSAHMRENVRLARQRAMHRFRNVAWSTNAHAQENWLAQYTPTKLMRSLDMMLNQETITMRGLYKILRIAWSIADLAGKNQPDNNDLLHAQHLYLSGVRS